MKFNEIMKIIRVVFSLLFLLMVAAIFMYSQFTATPITIETVLILITALVPIFLADTALTIVRNKNNNEKDE